MNEITEVRKESKKIGKGLVVLLCMVVAFASFFVAGEIATNPATYKKTIDSIDEKKATVMGITATAAATSIGLAAVPSDATTPVANEIMDISSCLMIVVCALVLEKSLLTVLGFLAFKILVPVACVMFAVSAFSNTNLWKVLSVKVAIFAIAIAFIVPISLKVSDLIYEVNKVTVEKVTDEVEYTDNAEQAESEEKGLKALWNKAKEVVETSVSTIVEETKDLTNKFIDAIAVFIIAYCAIPIFIFVLMGWILKLLFGIKVPIPTKNPLQAIGRKTDIGIEKGSDEEKSFNNEKRSNRNG